MPATSQKPIRLAILNDYPVVVEGVLAIFRSRPETFEIVYQTGDHDVAEEDLLTRLAVDVVLLDPFASSTVLRERIRRAPDPHRAKWVILAWYRTAAAVAEALELGVAGYLSKAMDAEALVMAVRDIHEGRYDVGLASSWPRVSSGEWPGIEHGLTARESEVMCWIAQGLSNQEISARAHIGGESLKTHIRSAYRKIGVSTRSQAIVWCISHGMLST